MEKALGIALQVTAACLFFAAGAGAAPSDGASLLLGLPGTIAGLGGLVLWSRGPKRLVEPLPAPPQPRQPRLSDPQIARLQEALAALQEDVSKLREDQDFFQRLYAPDRAPELPTARVHAPPR